MTSTARIKKKKSLTHTLRNMSVGESITIRAKDFRETIVRATASRLKKYGLSFSVAICDSGYSVKRFK